MRVMLYTDKKLKELNTYRFRLIGIAVGYNKKRVEVLSRYDANKILNQPFKK